MEVERIYFDMDGVLADFYRGIRELCGMEPIPQGDNQPPGYDDEMWARVRNVERFYDKLHPMPGAEELFRTIHEKYGDRCEILTGIPKPHRGIVSAAEDKTAWARRIFSPDLAVHAVLRAQKKDYCRGEGSILIDDLEKNIREWREFGGTGILFTSAENTLEELRRLGVL